MLYDGFLHKLVSDLVYVGNATRILWEHLNSSDLTSGRPPAVDLREGSQPVESYHRDAGDARSTTTGQRGASRAAATAAAAPVSVVTAGRQREPKSGRDQTTR